VTSRGDGDSLGLVPIAVCGWPPLHQRFLRAVLEGRGLLADGPSTKNAVLSPDSDAVARAVSAVPRYPGSRPLELALALLDAVLLADLLAALAAAITPYELVPGETGAALDPAIEALEARLAADRHALPRPGIREGVRALVTRAADARVLAALEAFACDDRATARLEEAARRLRPVRCDFTRILPRVRIPSRLAPASDAPESEPLPPGVTDLAFEPVPRPERDAAVALLGRRADAALGRAIARRERRMRERFAPLRGPGAGVHLEIPAPGPEGGSTGVAADRLREASRAAEDEVAQVLRERGVGLVELRRFVRDGGGLRDALQPLDGRYRTTAARFCARAAGRLALERGMRGPIQWHP